MASKLRKQDLDVYEGKVPIIAMQILEWVILEILA